MKKPSLPNLLQILGLRWRTSPRPLGVALCIAAVIPSGSSQADPTPLAQNWQTTFDGGTGHPPLDNFLSSPAIASDGTVYIAGSIGDANGNRRLYALSSTGPVKTGWPVTIGQRITSTSDKGIEASPALGPDGTIYIGSWDNTLYAINPSGTVKWTYTPPTPSQGQSPTRRRGPLRTTPIVAPGGVIYAFFDKHPSDLGTPSPHLVKLVDAGTSATFNGNGPL